MTDTLPTSFGLVHDRVRRSAHKAFKGGYHQLSFQSMSTACRVNFMTQSAPQAAAFQDEVLRWISWFEAQYSRFIEDSLIGRINAAAGLHEVEVDPETEALFNLCHEMVFLTKGVFDPTSLPLIRLWNWKAKPAVIPDAENIKATMDLVGWRKLQRQKGSIFLPRPGMCLDLGGIGKEFAVDRVINFALERGISNILVDFGQDVRVHGRAPERGCWHIGLDDPHQPGKCWTGVAVDNHAVATSGDYFRNFTAGGRRYGHILDPRDGHPVNNSCLAVSVIGPYCTMAGILSTSAFILGAREGLDLIRMCPGAEGVITTETCRVHTPNFNRYATK